MENEKLREFLSELKELLEKHRMEIWTELGEGSDTGGICDLHLEFMTKDATSIDSIGRTGVEVSYISPEVITEILKADE